MGCLHRILLRISFVQEFISLHGNQRVCIIMQPVWAIMFNLYSPYASLYMSRLGVTDMQIGLLGSLGMLLQVFTALFGGVLIDKMGRRRATVVFDLLSWSIPCLLWAAADNFAFFLVAAVFASFGPISSNAITSLLIEDCPPEKLVSTYALWSATGYIAAFFAPVSMLMVDRMGVVPTMRVLYFTMFIMITVKFVSFYFLCHETKTGIRKMEETRSISFACSLGGYREVLGEMLRTPAVRITLLISILLNIAAVVSGNFFALYITGSLAVPASALAVFPMLKSFIMLMVVFFWQRWLNCFSTRSVMLVGAVLYPLSHLCLLLCLQERLWPLAVYIVAESLAQALFLPRKDSLITLSINQAERARVMALIHVGTVALSIPFGYIGGSLASASRAYPFVFSTAIYLVCALSVAFSGSIRKAR